MLFLISLCLTLTCSWYGAKFIKRHAWILYCAATVLALAVIAWAHGGTPLWPILTNGPLATALFALVMYMAILPRGGKAVKRLLPIRAELSIIACILTLGHNLAHGKTYFVMLFTRPERLSGNLLWAAMISAVLIFIMLPLFITSFPMVRKKMKARHWKRLHRAAYGFYVLVYIHVMLLAREMNNQSNIIVYSAVFLTYGILRLGKALRKSHPSAARKITAGLSIAAVNLVLLLCFPEPVSEGPRREPAEPMSYEDGTYFGSADGYVGATHVAVTVSSGKIQSVVVISSEDDTSYVEEARDLIPMVIEAQHTALDAISGATYTSNAILDAIDNALKTE